MIGAAVSPLGAALGLFNRPKPPDPLPTATRDDTLTMIGREDTLSRRRGGAADILTSARGAEAAPASAKQLLGQ